MKRGRYLNKHKVFQPLEEVTRSNARFKHTLAEKYKIVSSIPISIANISAYDHAEAFLPSFLLTLLNRFGLKCPCHICVG